MKQYIGVLIFITTFLVSGQSQNINWMTWEEAIVASKEEPKKFFVDVYTQWCGWCKKMDASTFQAPEIIEYINEHYYAIKFDAESKDDIEIKDHVYRYTRYGKRGYHQLAAEITRGQLSFPTIVFLDERMNLIQPIPGFRDVESLEMILHYFAEDHHISTPWKTYSKRYNMMVGNRG